MSSRSLDRVVFGLCLLVASLAQAATLRVCADPDNLPLSHRNESGFENRIASEIARSLGAELHYFWWPQRRGFLRTTLNAGVCDVVIGMPVGIDGVRTTRPYYRSRYAFVQAADTPPIVSFDDERLTQLTIGLILPGDDMAATPPGEALSRRGIVANVHGYVPFGDRPVTQRILDDVESGRLDVAIVWGPQAGFFARRHMRLLLAVPAVDDTRLGTQLEFAIAMAVRRDDDELARKLDAVLDSMAPRIDALLDEFAMPRTDVAVTHDGMLR